LYAHPKIESDSARIRFAGFDKAGGLNLEVFSYIITRDMAEFTAICEDVFLRIMEAVEKSGSAFASPSRTISVARDSGLNQEKTQAAEQQVEQWREQNKLPFPDFASADKSALRGSIVYPEPESAVEKNQRLP